MSEPKGLHNHPTSGPVVIVHYRDEAAIGTDNPAHAFGPFLSEAAAETWEASKDLFNPCDCFKVILDLFDPTERRANIH